MKHYVKVKIITPKKTSCLLKLNKINVNIKNIKYLKDSLEFDILSTDIKRVKKYLVSYDLQIMNDTGIYKIKNDLKKNALFVVGIIFSIIIFIILSNIIVKINVIHSDTSLRELIYDALKERGVTPLSFKKSYDEYETIINEIKEAYPDKIEWLEIDVDGMVINVRLEERIINDYEKEYNYCHIVASKSGIISSITTTKGVAQVTPNSYVKEGDILINGMITLNEEVKNNVCANGSVYAEVWYNVSATLPLAYEEKEPTGKMRLNFMLKKDEEEYVILRSRVANKEVKNILLFKIFGIEFYIQKEYEVITTPKEYTDKEALEQATQLIHEKLNVKGTNINNIIEEKVLKKNLNNGNLYIEMFVAINEQIGVRKYYDIETDSGNHAQEHNGNNNSVD